MKVKKKVKKLLLKGSKISNGFYGYEKTIKNISKSVSLSNTILFVNYGVVSSGTNAGDKFDLTHRPSDSLFYV